MELLLPDGGWGSHKPLLQSLIEIFKPYFIMELGIGSFSTPILSKQCVKYVGIEQDLLWIEKILSLPELKNINILHHATDIKIEQRFEDLSLTQIGNLIMFYTILKGSVFTFKIDGYSMLFVDNYTGCRTVAIDTMYDAFDIICYHDSEAVEYYSYNFSEKIEKNYCHYTLTTDIIGTSVFIKKSLKHLSSQLENTIKPYIFQYAKENNMDVNLINFKKDKTKQ